MVNVPRVKNLSPFKAYELYHWDCYNSNYDNSVFNVTYNYNTGSFGSNFWSGVGFGLGASVMRFFSGLTNPAAGFGGWWGGGNNCNCNNT